MTNVATNCRICWEMGGYSGFGKYSVLLHSLHSLVFMIQFKIE